MPFSSESTHPRLHPGLRLRSALRAGVDNPDPFRSLDTFIAAFVGQALPEVGLPTLVNTLNATNEQCKQSGANGRLCDAWAAKFTLPFGRG